MLSYTTCSLSRSLQRSSHASSRKSQQGKNQTVFMKNGSFYNWGRKCRNFGMNAHMRRHPIGNCYPTAVLSDPREKTCGNNLCRYQYATNRNFFWGSMFGTTNPFLEALGKDDNKDGQNTGQLDNRRSTYIRYDKMKPDHISKAAVEFQSKYLNDLKILEESMAEDNPSYDDIIPELERIARPLTILQNHLALFSSVRKEPDFEDALHRANDTIQMRHDTSPKIREALVRMEDHMKTLKGQEVSEERKRVIRHLLLQHRLHGSLTQNEDIMEQVAATRTQLQTIQAKFLSKSSWTMEEHGKIAGAQDLLQNMYEMVSLQQHLSQLLGYDSYLEYSLVYHDAMANSLQEIESVHRLFEQLGAIQAFSSDGFQSLYLDSMSSTSMMDVKEYFELNHVLNGIFDFCQEMFGIIIKEQDGNEVHGWHRDVRLFHLFHVSKEDSEFPIASFYMDPYRRPYKDLGCFVTPLQYKNGDAIPVAAISFDFRPPAWDDSPIALELQDVVNIFHEFGHLLQHLLADVELGAFSGAQNIEEDASETMSQFMEYWLFDGDWLSRLSRSRKTGERIPMHIQDILRQQRKLKKANELLHRLFLGQLELELSSSFDPSGDESMIALQRKCAERFIPCQLPPKGDISPLIEVFRNNAFGKCSMQYRYMWSEILSADAFAAFLQKGNGNMLHEDEMRLVSERLQTKWLGVGSSVKTSDAFASFCGRDASMDALVSRYDLPRR